MEHSCIPHEDGHAPHSSAFSPSPDSLTRNQGYFLREPLAFSWRTQSAESYEQQHYSVRTISGGISRTHDRGLDRGVASTDLHEQGFQHQHIELQLAHSERDPVSAAYNHTLYLPQRTKMIQDLADYLDKANVTPGVTQIKAAYASHCFTNTYYLMEHAGSTRYRPCAGVKAGKS